MKRTKLSIFTLFLPSTFGANIVLNTFSTCTRILVLYQIVTDSTQFKNRTLGITTHLLLLLQTSICISLFRNRIKRKDEICHKNLSIFFCLVECNFAVKLVVYLAALF
jgi:hypothetical protein